MELKTALYDLNGCGAENWSLNPSSCCERNYGWRSQVILGYLTRRRMNLALILGSIHYGQVQPSPVFHLYLHLPALQGAEGQNKHRLAPYKGGRQVQAGASRCRQLHLYLHLPAFQEVVLTMTRLAKPEGLKEARSRLKGSLPVKG